MNPKLVVFDLDGTLTAPKQPLERDMAELLHSLLQKKKVALISGGWLPQMHKQFLPFLLPESPLHNLFLFPTCGARFFVYKDSWQEVYAETLTSEEVSSVLKAFEETFVEIDFKHPPEIFGEQIENRGTQITFSPLGQQAPLHLKESWDPDRSRRLFIAERLSKKLPNLTIKVAGSTSIDVTRQGIDKAFGIKKMVEHVKIPIEEMVFVGDGLFPGGNDHPVIGTGVKAIHVSGPEETKKIILDILSS